MKKASALVCLAALLTLQVCATGQVETNASNLPKPGSRLHWYASRAKEKGEKVVNINHGVGEPPGSTVDLQTALKGYDVVTAELLVKIPEVSADAIFTWYKFRVLSTLHRAPEHPYFPNAQRPPTSFGDIKADEFAFAQFGGTTEIEGVTIRDINPKAEILQQGAQYMMFINRGQDGVALVPGQLMGIYRMHRNTLIPQDHAASRLAEDITSVCHDSLDTCAKYAENVKQ